MGIKFKVGDKVKDIDFGYTGKIKNIDTSKQNPYQVEVIEPDWIFTFWFAEDDLELINEASSSNDDVSIN